MTELELCLTSPHLGPLSYFPHDPGLVFHRELPSPLAVIVQQEGWQPLCSLLPLRTLLGLGPLNMEVLSSRPRLSCFHLQTLQLHRLRQTHQTSPTFSWHLGAECVPFPTAGPPSWGRILRGEGLMDWHTGCDCLNGVTHSLPGPYTFCIAYLCLKHIKVNLRELP